MKVFISQPMNGKTQEQIIAERSVIIKEAESQGHQVLESVLNCKHNPKHRSVWYLAKSLELLAEADVAIFMKGWEQARGCKLEHEVAKQYDINILYE